MIQPKANGVPARVLPPITKAARAAGNARGLPGSPQRTRQREGTPLRLTCVNYSLRVDNIDGVDSHTITLTATLTPEEGGYVARCLELPVTTEGDTLEEALAALREAVELYLEDEPVPALPHPIVRAFDIPVPAA